MTLKVQKKKEDFYSNLTFKKKLTFFNIKLIYYNSQLIIWYLSELYYANIFMH